MDRRRADNRLSLFGGIQTAGSGSTGRTALTRPSQRISNAPRGWASDKPTERKNPAIAETIRRIADDNATRALWGTLSSIPFLYIVWELFKGLGESIERQPENVRKLIKDAWLITFASWDFYPIVYMIPYTNLAGPTVTTAVEVGYTIADLIAKAGVGIIIYVIAIRKSAAEYPELAK